MSKNKKKIAEFTYAFDWSKEMVEACERLGLQHHVYVPEPDCDMLVRASAEDISEAMADAGERRWSWRSKKSIAALIARDGVPFANAEEYASQVFEDLAEAS